MTTSDQAAPPNPSPGQDRRVPDRRAPCPGRARPRHWYRPGRIPHRFGRVDPDGTVWLITAAGERIIGSWQAGDTEAAYAHFGRRYEDLHTEVALMEHRLASGTGDARKIKSAAAALAESLPTAAVLGDVDALAARLTAIVEHAEAAAQAERANAATNTAPRRPPARRRWPSRPRRSPPMRRSGRPRGDRLRAILDEWRTITGLDRKTDDALWKRYSAARETFNRRRGSHFAELDRERVGVKQAKEALCERPRRSPTRPTGAPTAATFRDLLTRVEGRRARGQGRRRRAVGAVQGRAGQVLRGPQRRQRRAGRRVRRQRRRQGGACSPRPRRIDVTDADAARAAFRAIGDKWDAIGKVPRERGRRAGASHAGRGEEGARRRRPAGRSEAQARADQFRERAEQFEQQAEKAEAAGRPRTPSRPAPARRSGGSGPRPPPRRWARSARARARRRSASSSRSSSSVCAGAARRDPAALFLGGQLDRGAGPHHARPVERQQRCTAIHADDQPDTRARDDLSRRSGATTPQACRSGSHRRTGQRDPRQCPAPGEQRQHREPDAEHQHQPDEHPRRQRDGLAARPRRCRSGRPFPWHCRCAAGRTSPGSRTPGSRPPKPVPPGRFRGPCAVRRRRCRP